MERKRETTAEQYLNGFTTQELIWSFPTGSWWGINMGFALVLIASIFSGSLLLGGFVELVMIVMVTAAISYLVSAWRGKYSAIHTTMHSGLVFEVGYDIWICLLLFTSGHMIMLCFYLATALVSVYRQFSLNYYRRLDVKATAMEADIPLSEAIQQTLDKVTALGKNRDEFGALVTRLKAFKNMPSNNTEEGAVYRTKVTVLQAETQILHDAEDEGLNKAILSLMLTTVGELLQRYDNQESPK